MVATLTITALSYKFSRVMPGLGVGMPVFVAPLSSALLALILDPEHTVLPVLTEMCRSCIWYMGFYELS